MDTYTGVTYTKIKTKPSVAALQFSTSDLISYICIILGVKMWDIREYINKYIVFTAIRHLAVYAFLQHFSPLGKNDHCVIEFDFICTTVKDQQNHRKLYYNRGDYTALRKTLDII